MKLKEISLATAVAAFALSAHSQPVVDGVIDPVAEGYTQVGTNDPPRNTFGPSMTVHRAHVHDGPTTITIAVEGNSSFNNHITIYGDITGRTGTGSGTVPSGGPGAIGGHSGMVTPLSDIDFALTMNSGDNNNGVNAGGNDASAYFNWKFYGPTSGPGDYFGLDFVDDSVRDTSHLSGTFDYNSSTYPFRVAYSDGNNSGSAQATAQRDGLEIALPKAAFGTLTGANTLQLWIVQGSGGGFVSGDTIPRVTPNTFTGGPQLGDGNSLNMPAGTGAGGRSFNPMTSGTTAVPLPVSISEFAIE